MPTELIASHKNVTARGRDMVIVTTKSNAIVWVPKNQFNEQAETISYTILKKGDKYTSRTPNEKGEFEEGILKVDRNSFDGAGPQFVPKYSSMELVDRVLAAGKTPSFNLSN